MAQRIFPIAHCRQNSRRSFGFSLIELLLVIVIIAIIAALLLPVLSKSKQKAQQIQCVGNLHQQGLALAVFLQDNGGYPTWISLTNADPSERWWAQQLEHSGFGISPLPPQFWQNGVWRCPSGQARIGNIGTSPYYGYNVFGALEIGNLTNNFGLGGHYTRNPPLIAPVKESEVAVPADMMAIGESDGFIFMRAEGYDFYHLVLRHGNRANALFCDGHVESPTLQSLFADTNDAALNRWNRDHTPHKDRL